MNPLLNLPSPLQKLEDPLFREHRVEVYIKRDDLIDPEISGNKWRKLKYNIEKYYSGKYDSILTFGGAYSNHIAATAAAGRILNIPTIGVIRGEELSPESNLTLAKAKTDGMQLEFVARDIYEQRYERIYHEELRARFGNILIIEEGGANHLGLFGVAELLSELPFEPDHIYVAAGTGTTAAGILYASQKAIVNAVSVLKGGEFLKTEIEKHLFYALLDEAAASEELKRLNLVTGHHFGGYGKYNSELLEFMERWTSRHEIPLDQVYTGKMVHAFYTDLTAGKFLYDRSAGQTGKPFSKIVLVHTGGIQGMQL